MIFRAFDFSTAGFRRLFTKLFYFLIIPLTLKGNFLKYILLKEQNK